MSQNFPNCPQGYSGLSTNIVVQDPQKSIDFYTRILGFKVGETAKNERDGKIEYASLSYQGTVCLMLHPEGAYGSTNKSPKTSGVEAPNSFYMYVDDVDQFYKQLQQAGVKITMPLQDMFWGDRMFKAEDPDGYSWGFATNIHPHK